MAAIPNTVPVDTDILRAAQDALDACIALPARATPQEIGTAAGRAEMARLRLQLWLREVRQEQPA